jgi:hypothetical protein
MNSVIRAVSEKYVSWEATLSSFIRCFIQSDARALTALQLRSFFADKSQSGQNDLPIGDISFDADQFLPETLLLGTTPPLSLNNIFDSNDSMNLKKRLEALDHDFSPAVDIAEISQTAAMEDFEDINLGLPIGDLLGDESSAPTKKDNGVSYYQGSARLHFNVDEDIGDDHASNTISGVFSGQDKFMSKSGSAQPYSFLGERTSIMKTISNLWTGNFGNLLPLENPM